MPHNGPKNRLFAIFCQTLFEPEGVHCPTWEQFSHEELSKIQFSSALNLYSIFPLTSKFPVSLTRKLILLNPNVLCLHCILEIDSFFIHFCFYMCTVYPVGNLHWHIKKLKGIVSPDWKGLQMVSLDRFEV
jgi:hypothetical protein